GAAFWNSPAVQARLHLLTGPVATQALALTTSGTYRRRRRRSDRRHHPQHRRPRPTPTRLSSSRPGSTGPVPPQHTPGNHPPPQQTKPPNTRHRPREQNETTRTNHGQNKKEGPRRQAGPLPFNMSPAASYSPTQSPMQYHRR